MEKNDSFVNKNMDKFVSIYGYIFKKLFVILGIVIASIFFIVYEILIQFLWLGVTVKFVQWASKFDIMQKIATFIETKLEKFSRWESLFIFLIVLSPMICVGMSSLDSFLHGHFLNAIFLYLIKFVISIAVYYVYESTKYDIFTFSKYKNFEVSYENDSFKTSNNNEDAKFTINASNIPIGIITLPKFLSNLIEHSIKSSFISNIADDVSKKTKESIDSIVVPDNIKKSYEKTKDGISNISIPDNIKESYAKTKDGISNISIPDNIKESYAKTKDGISNISIPDNIKESYAKTKDGIKNVTSKEKKEDTTVEDENTSKLQDEKVVEEKKTTKKSVEKKSVEKKPAEKKSSKKKSTNKKTEDK